MSIFSNDAVDVGDEEGRIVIEPVRRPAHELSELLDGITPGNRHDAVEFGASKGK